MSWKKREKSKLVIFPIYSVFNNCSFSLRALQAGPNMEMYFGLLFPIEDYRVYGMYSNNHNKLVVICDSSGPEYSNMREVIISLSLAFVAAMQNPFQEIGKPLKSKRLDNTVSTVVTRQNQYAKRGVA